MFYGGTGCFHRRKVIYGVPPPDTVKHETRGTKTGHTKDEIIRRKLEYAFRFD